MTGILIEQAEQIKSCATDGHILQYIDDLDPQRQGKILMPFSGIVARKTINLLSQIPVSKIPVAVSEHYLRFKLTNGLELYSRLIEEQFPDFCDIIAEAKTHQVKVERGGLLKVLRIAGYFSHPDSHQGVLKIQDGLITVSTKDIERNLEFETSFPTLERFGAEMKIGFNLALLEQILAVLPEPEILWRYSSPITANLFSGIGNPAIINLIMPFRVEEDYGKCPD